MITLMILTLLFTLFLWYKHYKNHKKYNTDLNVFNDGPTLFSMSLVIFTTFSVAILLGLIITFLP